VLAAFAGLARQALHSFTSHSAGRQPSDLLAAIKRCYRLRNPAAAAAAASGAAGAVPIDWAALGRGASGRLFREAPGVACMLGPLQAQHKLRRRVQVRLPEAEDVIGASCEGWWQRQIKAVIGGVCACVLCAGFLRPVMG
jgi:hypothetical protein